MKRIALVDHLHEGHHLAFMRLFTKILLERGHEVWVFYPKPDAVRTWVEENCDAAASNVAYFELEIEAQTFERLGWLAHSFKQVRLLKETLTIASLWRMVGRSIKRAEKERGEDVELAFMCWLDSFLVRYLPISFHRAIFKYRWIGLYFHPRELRRDLALFEKKAKLSSLDNIFRSPKCLGVVTHDPLVESRYSQVRLKGKEIFLFPETADVSRPQEDHAVIREITAKAQGRVVVGLVGLTEQQGMLTMVRLAKIAPKDKYYFLFVGKVNAQDTSELLALWDEQPENCFFHFEYLQEGKEYNAFIKHIDILFLVYDDFSSTSNRLTKAANFKTVVLGSKRYCIGEDIDRYKLGATVEEGNVEQCLTALDELSAKLSLTETYECFDAYAKKHSYEALVKEFTQVIDHL